MTLPSWENKKGWATAGEEDAGTVTHWTCCSEEPQNSISTTEIELLKEESQTEEYFKQFINELELPVSETEGILRSVQSNLYLEHFNKFAKEIGIGSCYTRKEDVFFHKDSWLLFGWNAQYF